MTIDSPSRWPRGWTLNGPAFDRLLDALGTDRERAAVEYRQLHARVTGLLRWWGSPWPDELADETLDRVARKLQEGTEIAPGSLGAFTRGVARLVFYESTRSPRHQEAPLPAELEPDALTDESENERSLACLDQCLSQLPGPDRECVLGYYDPGHEKSIDARRRLASALGISPTALRIRAFRIRERLESCVSRCLEGA
jgi:DNA-directed RNA polymerase specialized sigma24 family protein